MYSIPFGFLVFLLAIGNVSAVESSEARKSTTERFLVANAIPVNPTLPLVEDAANARLRDAEDVAKRVLALNNVVAIGHGVDQAKLKGVLKVTGILAYMTPSERELVDASTPTREQLANASWRAEATWTLLWALGKVETLELPTKKCDVEVLQSLIPKSEGIRAFLASATLRSTEEILDETDRIYRIHWAVRDAQLKGKPVPGALNAEVVLERHYALNWLTGYDDDWDDVSTDT